MSASTPSGCSCAGVVMLSIGTGSSSNLVEMSRYAIGMQLKLQLQGRGRLPVLFIYRFSVGRNIK